MARPLKLAKTIDGQIQLLINRGLITDSAEDRNLARQWLSNVSYYRLSAYWHPARLRDQYGNLTEEFQQAVTLRDVVALYEADRKLRTLVLDGIERIESTYRARIVQHMCDQFSNDPRPHVNQDRFRSSFDHDRWLETAERRIDRAAEKEFIRHHETHYGGNYPFWVVAEVLDFRDLSLLFQGLKRRDQRTIDEELGFVVDVHRLSRRQAERFLGASPIAQWLHQLCIIRNTCAHHSRLWNMDFVAASTPALRTQEKFHLLPSQRSTRIFGALKVMAELLRVTSPNTTWPNKVRSLIEDEFLPNPIVNPEKLGLPEDIDWNLF